MVQDMLKDKVNGSTADILTALGLVRRRSPLNVIGSIAAIFTAGLVLGTAVGMLLAPKSGQALRQELKGKASHLADTLGEKAESATHEVRSALSMDGPEKVKPLQQGEHEGNAGTHRGA